MAVPYYPGSLYTPKLGLGLFGQDEVLADNMVILDAAFGSGSSINVNGTLVTSPNLSNTTPVAPGGNTNITFQVDVSGNISAYVPTSGGGGVTSITGDSVVYNNAASTGAVTLSLISQVRNTVFAGPTSGSNAAPTFRALVAADIPALPYLPASTVLPATIAAVASKWLNSYTSSTGLFTATQPAASDLSNGTTGTGAVVLASAISGFGSGTVTSFSAGTLSPLFTTSVATATTTPALTFSLSNAAGGTVFGNNTTGAAAPAYTIAPVLGIPGTSTGTIALASSTASGKYTITAPANAATPTLTLPTTSNVLAGQVAGDGTVFATALVVASAAGTITLPTPQNQNANLVFAGPSSGGAAAPTFRSLVATDIPAITVPWSSLTNAASSLTLANGTNTTTFNQTSAAAWLWANTTTATSGTTNASPLLELAANYWTGAASAADTWTLQSSLAAGTNGASTLAFAHSGSSGAANVQLPSAAILQWSTDTGIFRQGAGVFGFGNGASGNFSGTLDAANYSCFNGATAVGRLVTQSSTQLNLGAVVSNGTIGINSNLVSGAGPGVTIGGFSALTTTTGVTGVQIGQGSSASVIGSLVWTPASGSGNFIAFNLNPGVNQSGGTGSYTALQIAVVETALLGSSNYLINCLAGASGTTQKFSVTNAGLLSEYGGIATVSNGVPSELAKSDLTAQSAAITATTLYATTATGMYRVSWSATITTAGTTSVLGGTNGFQVLYTSPTDSVVKTTVSGNSVTSAANTTGTAVGGCEVVYAKTGTNIQFTYDYTSTGTSMVYELHIKVEAL